MKYECFEINDDDEYDCFWIHMCQKCTDFYNVTDSSFTNKKEYSSVRNLIIIFHGISDGDGFNLRNKDDQWVTLYEDFISESADFSNCPIDYIDLQSCLSLRDYDGDGDTVAELLAGKERVKRVFASDGPMRYAAVFRSNWTSKGHHIYMLYKDSDGKVQRYPFGQSISLVFWE